MLFEELPSEVKRQDELLSMAGLRRLHVKPDEACFFSAVARSARCYLRSPSNLTGSQLRRETSRELINNVSLYKSLVLPPKKSISSADTAVFQDLRDQGTSGHWIAYESVLAVSKLLSAAILVTSGGLTDHHEVVTDRVYFGEDVPRRSVHVCWVSAGYYDAVVRDDHVLDSGEVLYGLQDNRLGFTGDPLHIYPHSALLVSVSNCLQ